MATGITSRRRAFPAATMKLVQDSAEPSDSSDARRRTRLRVLCRTRCSSFFFAPKVCISANAEEVNQHADYIPNNHGSRNNQDAIVDPEDLKEAYDRRHPWVHARSRSPPEHRHQIRQNGKRGSQSGDKTKEVRTLESRKENALRVMKKLLAPGEHHHGS